MDRKFETLEINQINEVLSGLKNKATQNHKEFITGLAWVSLRKRWVDDPAYKKSSFNEYSKGRFGVTEDDIRLYLSIYIKFDSIAQLVGAPKILKARSRVGKDRIEGVVKRVEKIQQERKTPIDVNVFDREVQKEFAKKQKQQAKPKKKAPLIEQPKDKVQMDYEQWQYDRKVKADLETQIQRLKTTNTNLKEENAELHATIARLRKALETARQALGPVLKKNPPESKIQPTQ